MSDRGRRGARGSGRGRGPGQYENGRGASRGGQGSRGAPGPTAIEVFKTPGGNVPQPDPEVARTENDFIRNSAGTGALAALKLTSYFPQRPAHGTQGSPTTVFANYYALNPIANLSFYRYNLNVVAVGKTPKLSKRRTKRVITQLLESPAFKDVATDFTTMLVSRTKIESVPSQTDIALKDEGADEPSINAPMYRVSVQEAGSISVFGLVDYLKSTRPDEPKFGSRFEALQVLNIIFGHFPRLRPDVATLGDNKHISLDGNSKNYSILSPGVVALRGFFKSVRPATSRLLLNVNVSHFTCYEPLGLDKLMRAFGLEDKVFLARQLKRLQVRRLHLSVRKNRAGRVVQSVATVWDLATNNDGHSQDKAPIVSGYAAGPKNVKFWVEAGGPASSKGNAKGQPTKSMTKSSAGRYISVWDYFLQNYPLVKMDPDLPVLNTGNRENPCYLPAEVCRVLPGQPLGMKLNPNQTRAMIEFACRRPKENAESIVGDGREVLNLGPDNNSGLTKNGIQVGQSLITVPARVLQPPQIKYLNNSGSETPRFGSWNMDKKKFFQGATIKKWAYASIMCGRSRGFQSEEHLRKTVTQFQALMKSSGMIIGDPIPQNRTIDLIEDRGKIATAANEQLITTLIRGYYQLKENKPQFLLMVLPFNDAFIYRTIKRIGDTKAGIHTVCVLNEKFAKENRKEQYFANVALKFNLKAGGTNHVLDPLKLGIVGEGNTMVVGIDVTHPSPESESSAPSVAGIVASVDRNLGQWPADLRIQDSRKEMVTDLQDMLVSRLRVWQARNKGALPKNILIYRDGVSEGQYQTVLDDELPLIRRGCETVYLANVQPKISIIIVGKRHHTRFYPSREADADRSANCKNGTVVDRGVTEVRFWHFYLQAHACLQGTARPAHYYVILDEIFRADAASSNSRNPNPNRRNAADALEDLTHNMCHLFGRATKAVSICPPAYYADLLCERARCYLSGVFDPAGGPAGSSSAGSSSAAVAPSDILIQDVLKDTMFYI